MKVLLHSGPGFIGAAIRWQTDSDWSHASLWFPRSREVIESREFKGVVRTPLAAVAEAMHRTPGLRVAVYDFAAPLTRREESRAYWHARSEEGAGYDYPAIFRFVTRARGASDSRWFCSEFVAHIAEKHARRLFNETPAWRVTPGLLPRSLALQYAGELSDFL